LITPAAKATKPLLLPFVSGWRARRTRMSWSLRIALTRGFMAFVWSFILIRYVFLPILPSSLVPPSPSSPVETLEERLFLHHSPVHPPFPPSPPPQVPGSGPAGEDDPSSLSFSHVEALEVNPILHETWEYTDGGREGGAAGKKGPFVVSMERYITAWILKG